MKTFTTGKIRKNAKNQIKALLEMATQIAFSEYSFDMYSDCYTYDDDVITSVDFAVNWMADNYRDLSVFLTCDADGQPKELTISAFGGYFTITFAPVEVKPALTLEQVTEALEAGYVSPLNSDEMKQDEIQNEAEPVKQDRTTSIGVYLDTLITEKGRETEDEINLPGHFGLTYDHLIDFVESADRTTQIKIKTMLTSIDFKNGDVFHFLNHLAKGMTDSIAIH